MFLVQLSAELHIFKKITKYLAFKEITKQKEFAKFFSHDPSKGGKLVGKPPIFFGLLTSNVGGKYESQKKFIKIPDPKS